MQKTHFSLTVSIGLLLLAVASYLFSLCLLVLIPIPSYIQSSATVEYPVRKPLYSDVEGVVIAVDIHDGQQIDSGAKVFSAYNIQKKDTKDQLLIKKQALATDWQRTKALVDMGSAPRLDLLNIELELSLVDKEIASISFSECLSQFRGKVMLLDPVEKYLGTYVKSGQQVGWIYGTDSIGGIAKIEAGSSGEYFIGQKLKVEYQSRLRGYPIIGWSSIEWIRVLPDGQATFGFGLPPSFDSLRLSVGESLQLKCLANRKTMLMRLFPKLPGINKLKVKSFGF